ncbi:hypothetical protein COU01_03920 [Candidatus Falkowbacteria bacterium CG10_big_fil_rev_8_21_14_0_10_44_15]|uniref:Uncharacterized protein n=1 Tax=Candidatus Falkowbacteria bacterium CG10_big_fil_rev_8_21_14_0_10_44_15 TaxID=1974569 RepID=A0A2H0UYZ7_9BACT|nr:MAG: hypothetical protein COU01_03920 [Candidatus Falkowbacteria bacterium CG10_big_fil_rev_8_21_14_0_10_44_15]
MSTNKPGADSVAVVGELRDAGYQEAPYFLKGCFFLVLPEDEESETDLVLMVGLNDSQRQQVQTNAKQRKTVLLADDKIGIGLPPELRENGLLPLLQVCAVVTEHSCIAEFSIYDLPICPSCSRVWNEAIKKWETYKRHIIQDMRRDGRCKIVNRACDECE